MYVELTFSHSERLKIKSFVSTVGLTLGNVAQTFEIFIYFSQAIYLDF